MYEHRYKHGKQKEIMPLAVFQAAVNEAIDRGAPLNHLAYVTGLWHTGVRKSELYERLLSDTTITKEFVIVDFHKRKKNGEEVPPLKIPRAFYGVEEFMIPWINQRHRARPPHKYTQKRIFFQEDTGEIRITEKGKKVTIKKTVSKVVKDWWLFPKISSVKAWQIVKEVLGPKFYPHYLRLRKLSAIARNPKTKSIIHIKSVSGLKSVTAIQAYMGIDQDAQEEAMKNE